MSIATGIRNGDRVLVTFEATWYSYALKLDGGGEITYPPSEFTIERLDPSLPTTPGSVIRSGDLENDPPLFWVLSAEDHLWYGRNYMTKKADCLSGREFLGHDFEVVFDAGAS